jgi:hypothetical protein
MTLPNLFRRERGENNVSVDVELGHTTREQVHGYPAAAAFIASDPDRSLLIYRCFQLLSSRNLLYLEAELLELEKQQDCLDIEDIHGSQDAYQCLRSWKRLVGSEDSRQRQRLDLIKSIRSTLKEYCQSVDFNSSL